MFSQDTFLHCCPSPCYGHVTDFVKKGLGNSGSSQTKEKDPAKRSKNYNVIDRITLAAAFLINRRAKKGK